jgi:hypothetical protein
MLEVEIVLLPPEPPEVVLHLMNFWVRFGVPSVPSQAYQPGMVELSVKVPLKNIMQPTGRAEHRDHPDPV